MFRADETSDKSYVIRTVTIVLIGMALLLAAMAGNFFEETNIFLPIAITAIGFGAAAAYLAQKSSEMIVESAVERTDEKLRKIQKQIDEFKTSTTS
jgi:hypothetical protein